MSSVFCSMEEAFNGPLVPSGGAPLFPGQKPPKHKRRKDGIESFVSPPPPPDRQVTPAPEPQVLRGPAVSEQQPVGGSGSGGNSSLDGGVGLQEFFPLPGETAGTDEWTKAFTLEPSAHPGIPVPRFDGSVPVNGKPTLWRQIPVPPVAANELAPLGQAGAAFAAAAPADIMQRLDALTQQLEGLTKPNAGQSTAELFLFVAIGLLVLLAVDTLLRFATHIAQRGGARSAFRINRQVHASALR